MNWCDCTGVSKISFAVQVDGIIDRLQQCGGSDAVVVAVWGVRDRPTGTMGCARDFVVENGVR